MNATISAMLTVSQGSYEWLVTDKKFDHLQLCPEVVRRQHQRAPEVFTTPQGYSGHIDRQANSFNAVRTRKKVVEDEVFGNNAALGCHLANHSYSSKSPAVWDDQGKRIKT